MTLNFLKFAEFLCPHSVYHNSIISSVLCFSADPLFPFDAHLLLLFSCHSVPPPETLAVPLHKRGILVAASHGSEPPQVCPLETTVA
jgi:hypothetical protein